PAMSALTAPVASRVALVTGASRGIGREVARVLASRGVRIALHYNVNRRAADETLASLAGTRDLRAGDARGARGAPPHRHAAFAADLTRADAPEGLVAAVLDAFGRIDILVNNAGIYELHPAGDTSFATWSAAWGRTLAANLTGPAHLSFLAARAMRGHGGGGRIVNVTSRGAFRGEPTAPAYAAAKAGLNALGQSMAKALAPEGILVFALAPGWVDTDMAAPHLRGPGGAAIVADIPLGRVATASEVADAIAWLALDAPPSMTGSIVDMNGASYLRA
ncbi:MAG TPA: SDR family oxidoreductase, partial [Polyangiaceae bacterium]